MQDRKTAEAGKKTPRAYRGGGERFIIWRKKNCRLGGKICRLKKKCWLENFPYHSRKCPDIPWNARPKNGRGVKKPPRSYRGGEKSFSFGQKKFFVGWKNKMLVGKKTCRLKKKCRLENFPCQNGNGNVRTFPEMQDQKTAEA